MIFIKGNKFLMGSPVETSFPTDFEYPQQQVIVNDFYIDPTPVTNKEFKEFVDATGYITIAEKQKSSFVFYKSLSKQQLDKLKSLSGLTWWYDVPSACWYLPEGDKSNINDRLDHPVVHIARIDAIEYCKWANKRLPTEAEWEYAARGGLENKIYPWGNNLFDEKGNFKCNIWKGNFPNSEFVDYGFIGTKPVKTFEPNGYGLYQMTGNVWEWCLNKRGIEFKEFNNFNVNKAMEQYEDNIQFAIRGGSFLCHDSYCQRYKVFSRNGTTSLSTANNLSFRCVKDI